MSNHFNGLEKLSSESQHELETFLKLYVPLYAIDTIIMAESDQELQLALSELNDYCKIWSLKINVTKTKIVIVSRGKVKKYHKFTIGNEEVQVCDDYVYLGVTFNFNGSFRKAIIVSKLPKQEKPCSLSWKRQKSWGCQLILYVICLINLWYQCYCMVRKFGDVKTYVTLKFS